ncbi:helix-turn-helix and ligand-binding sensor domain-containing protein [Salinimicrobium gaetbulicola]|uniref:Histidine kinase n=1 Tax=Salinimicrobium gaetbulicola TaxID=999702 RepID=A0ABW3IIQ2_9FLAO
MRTSYISVLLIFMSCIASAQELIPPIQNHTSIEYNGASQNWDLAIDDSGIIYAANNQGLLSFDGLTWELFQLDTGGIIRSVLPHGERIYTGSYQEFGYWSRDLKGEMHYTSLMSLLKEYTLQSEEFWEILTYKDAIYFRSFGAIYEYKKGKIKPIKEIVSNKMIVFNDRLLIAVGKEGLFYLETDGSLNTLPNQEILSGKRVLDLEVVGDDLFIGTAKKLYKFDGSSVTTYHSNELNRLLSDFEFNHLTKFSQNELLIATLRNGLILHNIETGNTSIFNRESGLQNNTVLGMAKRNGKVWLGLDNGIDEIDLASPIKFYTDHTGELGAVYDLAFYRNSLYAASNTGVYRLDNNGITMIKGAQGHSWNLEVLDDVLYSNHNSGTYKVVDDTFKVIENRTGSFQIIPVKDRTNTYLIGNYTGISIYEPSGEMREFTELNFPVKKIIFEGPSVIWAEHANEGIYRLGINSSLDEISFKDQIGHEQKGLNHRLKIFKLNGQIAILKNKDWYQYNKFKDTLELFKDLKNYRNHELLLEDELGYWFRDRLTNDIKFTNFRDTELEVSFKELNMRTVKGNERMIKAKDSIFYLTLKDGFAKIDLNALIDSRSEVQLSQPVIKGVIDLKQRYDLTDSPTIPYNSARQLTFLAGLPDSDAAELHYELSGEQNIEGHIIDGKLTFQNLSQGDYQLKLFALGPQGTYSEVTKFKFVVDSPWYLSNLMLVVYAFLILATIVVVYTINKRKLKKHQHLLEQRLEREHRERIERLEKKRLKDEIMIKRKELANTTMMAAKKNEVLMDIQGELNKDKDKFSNQYRLKHIMTKINQAIKNKDEWQVFETNFKEVHEDFSKDLLESFPHLTSKDLKLCSYLKMNLTSKEIAPLMGKSVRGVEVHRYRLRKKMELDSQENLSNYLIKNF